MLFLLCASFPLLLMACTHFDRGLLRRLAETFEWWYLLSNIVVMHVAATIEGIIGGCTRASGARPQGSLTRRLSDRVPGSISAAALVAQEPSSRRVMLAVVFIHTNTGDILCRHDSRIPGQTHCVSVVVQGQTAHDHSTACDFDRNSRGDHDGRNPGIDPVLLTALSALLQRTRNLLNRTMIIVDVDGCKNRR